MSFVPRHILIYDSKKYIYTGCQILNKSIFKSKEIKYFSIFEIWLDLMKNNNLGGFESKNEFRHVSDLEIFKKLIDH